MKNSTIRLIVILATLSIIGITITQLYWVGRAFNLKETEFERTVNTGLYNVAQQIYELKETPSPANNPVRQLSTNYFVVMVNSDVTPQLLEFLLRTEFEKRNIKTDFEYGIYDCTNEKMVYGNYVSLKSNEPVKTKSFPAWSTQGYYFGVMFPNREAHIINQMGIWLFSSIVLLVVIVFFAYTLFVILKQKRLSEIQKDFVNNMTHEFKTPISTIAVSTEVLKESSIVSQPARLLNYASIIEKENIRLKNQVERVLNMARLDREDVDLKKEQACLHQLLEEAIQNSHMMLDEKQGEIVTSWQALKSEIKADRLHLTNVFTNLIDNAVKYCSVSPAISIQTENLRNGIVIEIRDNGIGISADNQRRIFQKFFRVSTGNVHDVKGFGLGLSYVKKMVESHGGNVRVKSTLGNGSTFSIFFPI